MGLMVPCIPSDLFLRLVGHYGKISELKSSCFILSFFIITWSCISLTPPRLFSAALGMDEAGKCLLKPFCQKITKDPISLAHSMTAGLAVSKKPLGLCSLSSKILFLNLVWILVRSLRLPPDPTKKEDGTRQALLLTRSPDTDQGSLSHMRNGL